MDDASHVAELVRSADRDRYMSVLYAPHDRRRSLLALYAFNAEIASVRDRAREALAGEIRLRWWADILALPPSEKSGNPVADELRLAISRHNLPLAAFEHMLEARTFDLYDDPMPDRETLEGYCGETAGALIQLAAVILDVGGAAIAAEAAGHGGCAQAISGLLRSMPIHRRRGQCFIPANLLSAAGTNRDEFLSAEPGQAGLRALEAMQALARDHLGKFQTAVQDTPSSLRAAFLPLAVIPAYLDGIERLGSRAFYEVAAVSHLRRNWLILKRAVRGW